LHEYTPLLFIIIKQRKEKSRRIMIERKKEKNVIGQHQRQKLFEGGKKRLNSKF
jgi:hypothetical protein